MLERWAEVNIFHLDRDPERCARLHCDKHVGKMLVETVQMLSTALVVSGGSAPWKPAFQNHPMNRWVRESAANFAWSWDLADALGDEYVYRFGKSHRGQDALRAFARDDLERLMGPGERTPPPLCMEDACKVGEDAVASYRRFYATEKARFARWTRRPVPDFMRDSFIPMTAEEVEASDGHER